MWDTVVPVISTQSNPQFPKGPLCWTWLRETVAWAWYQYNRLGSASLLILLSHFKFATVSSNDSELGKESSPGRATGWVMRTIGGARRNMWSSSGCGAAAAVAQGAFGRCGVNSLACDMAVGGAGSAGLAVIHRKTIVKPAPSGERQHMDSIETVGITCHHYGTRRRAGCNAWRASRQRLLHVVTTTVGRIFAGRAAAHGERRRSRYCLSSLRQRAV